MKARPARLGQASLRQTLALRQSVPDASFAALVGRAFASGAERFLDRLVFRRTAHENRQPYVAAATLPRLPQLSPASTSSCVR